MGSYLAKRITRPGADCCRRAAPRRSAPATSINGSNRRANGMNSARWSRAFNLDGRASWRRVAAKVDRGTIQLERKTRRGLEGRRRLHRGRFSSASPPASCRWDAGGRAITTINTARSAGLAQPRTGRSSGSRAMGGCSISRRSAAARARCSPAPGAKGRGAPPTPRDRPRAGRTGAAPRRVWRRRWSPTAAPRKASSSCSTDVTPA